MRKVQVRYVRNGKVTTMAPAFANILEGVGLVEPYDDREPRPEISPKTGKPKRKYTRRDLKAED